MSSPRKPGAQDPTGPGLLRPPRWQGPGPADCDPEREVAALTGRDGGEVHHHLKAWAGPAGGLGEGSGALQDTAPPPLSPSRSLVSWRAPGRRLESVSYLTLCLPGDHHSIDCWLTAEPLTVTH